MNRPYRVEYELGGNRLPMGDYKTAEMAVARIRLHGWSEGSWRIIDLATAEITLVGAER